MAFIFLAMIVALIIPIKNRIASSYISQGNELLKSHYYRSAIEKYEKASILSPKNYDLKIQLSDLSYLLGDKESSIRYLEEATNANRKETRGWHKLLEALLETKNLEKATQIISKMSEESLNNIDIKIQYCRIMANISQTEEALNQLDSLDTKESKFYQTIFLLKNERIEEAQNIFSTIKEQDKKELGYYEKIENLLEKIDVTENNLYKKILIAQAFNEIDEPYLAEQIFLEILTQDPDYRDGNTFLGYSYILQNKPDQAIKYLNKSLSKDDIYGITYYFLGKAYLNKNDENQAKINFKKAYQFGYRAANLLSTLGDLEKNSGGYTQAEIYYEKLLGKKDDFETRLNLIQVRLKQGKKDEAEKTATESKNSALLGYYYLEIDNLGEAKKNITDYEKISPYSPLASLWLGDIENKNNNKEKAKNYYKKTIELDTDGKWAKEAEEKLASL